MMWDLILPVVNHSSLEHAPKSMFLLKTELQLIYHFNIISEVVLWRYTVNGGQQLCSHKKK